MRQKLFPLFEKSYSKMNKFDFKNHQFDVSLSEASALLVESVILSPELDKVLRIYLILTLHNLKLKSRIPKNSFTHALTETISV